MTTPIPPPRDASSCHRQLGRDSSRSTLVDAVRRRLDQRWNKLNATFRRWQDEY